MPKSSLSKYTIDNNKYSFFRKMIKDLSMKFINSTHETKVNVSGSYGEVSMVKFHKKSASYVKKTFKDSNDIETILAEVRTLTLEGCSYFPKIIYSGYTSAEKWCLILEYVDGGTLHYHLFKKRPMFVRILIGSGISDSAKKTIAYQIALGMEFLHERNLTHGSVLFV